MRQRYYDGASGEEKGEDDLSPLDRLRLFGAGAIGAVKSLGDAALLPSTASQAAEEAENGARERAVKRKNEKGIIGPHTEQLYTQATGEHDGAPIPPTPGRGGTDKHFDGDQVRGANGMGGCYDGDKWIQGAIKHPGALHRELGVPEGKKIPAKKLAKAEHAGGKLGQRARLAETLKGLHK
jgi:hypothetical protein